MAPQMFATFFVSCRTWICGLVQNLWARLLGRSTVAAKDSSNGDPSSTDVAADVDHSENSEASGTDEQSRGSEREEASTSESDEQEQIQQRQKDESIIDSCINEGDAIGSTEQYETTANQDSPTPQPSSNPPSPQTPAVNDLVPDVSNELAQELAPPVECLQDKTIKQQIDRQLQTDPLMGAVCSTYRNCLSTRHLDWCRWPICLTYYLSGHCPLGEENCPHAHCSKSFANAIDNQAAVAVCFDSLGLANRSCNRPPGVCKFFHAPAHIRRLLLEKRQHDLSPNTVKVYGINQITGPILHMPNFTYPDPIDLAEQLACLSSDNESLILALLHLIANSDYLQVQMIQHLVSLLLNSQTRFGGGSGGGGGLSSHGHSFS